MKRLFLPLMLAAALLLAAGCGQGASSGLADDDFYLLIDGVSYRCMTGIESVIEQMGDGYEYAEGRSCAYDGLDKTFSYEAVQFFTNPLDAGDMVSEIYTESPSAATSKGIRVGDSKSEVLKRHGPDAQDSGNLLVYPRGEAQGALCFEMENDRVIAIFVTTEAI